MNRAKEFSKIEVKPRRPLQLKILGLVSLLFISTVGIIIVLATYFFKQDNIRRVKSLNLKTVELVGQKVQSDLEAIIDKTRQAAISLKNIKPGSVNRKQFEELFYKNNSEFLFVGIFQFSDTEARVIDYTHNETLFSKNGFKQEQVLSFLQENRIDFFLSGNNKISIFNPSSFLHSREPIVGLGVPSEKGVFLVALSSLRKIQLAFDKMSINTSFMVNGKGIILAHSEDKLSQVAIDYSGHEMVKFMFNNKLGNGLKLYKDIEGKSYIGAYKKLSFGNAGVISFINEDLAMEEVYNIQRRNLYIMIIALCISLLILYYLTEKITRPLMKLLVETIKISQGEFKVNIEKETEDEVGLLSEYFIQMARGLDERERVKEAFTRFINKDIVNKVIRGEISLGGELRKAAIFFSDVRGFTAIAEKISPEELILFLNGYLSLMVSCIGSHHGIVVDLMGDGIYAAWGATYTAGNDCENAINSALTMRKTLIQYNNYREKEGDEPIQIGCGINYGEVISGMVGSFDRMQYSLIGDTVNYASRLESLNKAFDTDILISEEAKQEVEGIYKLEKLKPVKVKGKEKEQQVYAVLGRMDDPDCPSDLNSLRVLLKITSIGLSEKEKEKLKEGHEEKYDVLD